MCTEDGIIYVRLLNEGTDVYRPVKGKYVNELTYKIVMPEDYDPEDENWEFAPNSIVRCELQTKSGMKVLVAVSITG